MHLALFETLCYIPGRKNSKFHFHVSMFRPLDRLYPHPYGTRDQLLNPFVFCRTAEFSKFSYF